MGQPWSFSDVQPHILVLKMSVHKEAGTGISRDTHQHVLFYYLCPRVQTCFCTHTKNPSWVGPSDEDAQEAVGGIFLTGPGLRQGDISPPTAKTGRSGNPMLSTS